MISQNKTVREVLGLLTETAGLSEAELSRQTGVSQPTIHRLLSGATPDTKISTLKPIAEFFKVTIGQLAGIEPLPMPNSSQNRASHQTLIKVPIIPWDNAFEWAKLISQYVPSNWEYWTTLNNEIGKNSYALIVKKQHLLPPFNDNAVIIVDPDAKPESGNHIVVYKISDKSVIIKKLHYEGTEKWLMPLNKKLSAELLNNNFLVCGIVVQANTPLLISGGKNE